MKRKIFSVLIALVLVLSLSLLMVAPALAGKPDGCTTIQEGTIVDVNGNVVTVGYDQWGYNYQAHMFNGFYENYSRPDTPVTEGDIFLQMKWSDTWLSNKDCNGDSKLDRGYKCDPVNANSSACFGAWLTNHQWGLDEDGNKWTYFVKIVAVPDDANLVNGTWYTADNIEIGPAIWGAYAKILQVSNDKALEEHGVLYKSPASPGFGVYKP